MNNDAFFIPVLTIFTLKDNAINLPDNLCQGSLKFPFFEKKRRGETAVFPL